MIRSRFFRQLFWPYLLLIAVTTAALGVFAGVRLRGSYIDGLKQAMDHEAGLVGDLTGGELAGGERERLQEEVRRVGLNLGRRVTVIDADGVVLADNESDPAKMENHGTRPEILEAKARGQGMSIRPSDTIHTDLLYVARRVQSADGETYYVRLSYHLTELRRHLRVLYSALAVAAGVAILAAGMISFYLARRRTAPVVELTGFADALAHGDLNRRILDQGEGEMGLLAGSLNKMADGLNTLVSQMAHDKSELLTILTSMSDGVIVTDTQQRITLVNEAAARLLDFPAGQAGQAADRAKSPAEEAAPAGDSPGGQAGRMLWEVVRAPAILKAGPAALETRQKQTVQITLGPARHLQVTVSAYPAQGAAQGLILVAHDVSQSRRYEELRKEFVANVSHELRTPLSVIKGYVETLRDGAMEEPERARQYLATIAKHTDQLSNLVSDLLELSRLESQPGPMRTARVEMAPLLRRAAELLLPAAQRKGQELTVAIAGDLPAVIGNGDYLERAVSNLIDNAVKYTPERGKVTLGARREEKAIVIEVSDNGIGIPADDLPRIFERFYRVDRSRSRDMGGTGLGLSIVKHVAQAHGGTVEVESRPGAGSVFRLRLAGVGNANDAEGAPLPLTLTSPPSTGERR